MIWLLLFLVVWLAIGMRAAYGIGREDWWIDRLLFRYFWDGVWDLAQYLTRTVVTVLYFPAFTLWALCTRQVTWKKVVSALAWPPRE